MKKLFFSFLAIYATLTVCAQPFAEDIAVFKKKDSIAFPPKNAILFVGSSSFTKWTDVQDYFPKHTIINRGFGGSSLTDLYYYAVDIIFPYEPKQIVIYCGENDFAGNDSLQPKQLAQRFVKLYELIRSKYKKTPIAYISMKPSPSRERLLPKFIAANKMIKTYLSRQRKTDFIDVYDAMLQKDGTPMTDIFLEDNLHMNSKGYLIWQKIIEPYLKK